MVYFRHSSLALTTLVLGALPVSGTIAYRYLIGAGWLRVRVRFAALAMTQGQAARRLMTEREQIVTELERAKQDYLTATKGSSF